ncbi:MAG: hypothetical protein FWC20_11110 [Oscillospiraceae bacterium]|nr:hypothetical protein [Oscillospiraceae bacterium]MCL2279936.1 hypothetical protein [Oscillospiraceae bacterium]
METPVHAPFSVKIRIEIAKLRKMNFREKMEYIWEYYKPLLIGIVVFLLISGSLINTWFINPPPQTALLIEWSADFVLNEQLVTLAETLTKQLVDETENEIVSASLFFETPDDPQMMMAMVSRRMALLSAGELDVFIQNFEQLRGTALNGTVMPLDAVLAEVQSISPLIFNIAEERLIYALYDPFEDGGQEQIMGVDISGSPLLQELGFHERELIFSVAISSNRLDNVVRSLILLLEGL